MIDEVQTYQTPTDSSYWVPFLEAEINFHFTEQQGNTFSVIGETITRLKRQIGDTQLNINIGMTADDEIFISRKSTDGVSNLLIYEDGTIAHSFIPYKESNKQDFLYFLEPVDTISYEQLLLQFFSC